MNKIFSVISIYCLLISSAFGATAQVNDVISLGGVTQGSTLTVPSTNPSGFFTLYAGAETVTGTHVFPFYKNGAAYQVTAGKTFKANKMCTYSTSTSVLAGIMSDTATFATNADISTLVSPIYQLATASVYAIPFFSSASTWLCHDMTFEITQNRWAGVQISAVAAFRFIMTGIEI